MRKTMDDIYQMETGGVLNKYDQIYIVEVYQYCVYTYLNKRKEI